MAQPRPLEYLGYVDPLEFWKLVAAAQARSRGDVKDEQAWQDIYDELQRNGGLSSTYAERWVKGLRKLTRGEWPNGAN